MADPKPGTCIYVEFQNGKISWVSVIMKRPNLLSPDRIMCTTIPKGSNRINGNNNLDRSRFEKLEKRIFFSPALVRQNKDPVVKQWIEAQESASKEKFRNSEVSRLQTSISPNGQMKYHLEEFQQELYDGYRTGPSQFHLEAYSLKEKSLTQTEIKHIKHIKNMITKAAHKRELVELSESFNNAGHESELLKEFSEKSRIFRKKFKDLMANPSQVIPKLHHGKEYQCFAEFNCTNTLCVDESGTKHRWRTIKAWAKYDLENASTCSCSNPSVGCVHTFRDPKNPERPPYQLCKLCGQPSIASKCKLLTTETPMGHHYAEGCPKCKELGTWCTGSSHRESISLRLGLMAKEIDRSIEWKPCEAGVQANILGQSVLLIVKPWLFMIPDDVNHDRLFTPTGQEPELLRGDRIPAGSDRLKLFQLALDYVHKHGEEKIGKNFALVRGNAAKALEFLFSYSKMGGLLAGAWRAFSLKGAMHYGERFGVTYYKPKGWIRHRIKLDDAKWSEVKSWPLVYHGTTKTSAAEILFSGLKKPELKANAHGQAGSPDGRSIYVSPSIYLASFPIYTPLVKIEHGLWSQCVLQCKVRPGSYKVQRSTLSHSNHWPRELRMDPNFRSNEELEFLVQSAEDVVVIGLMFRKLGRRADSSLYGDLPTRVLPDENPKGPEYHLTELLEQHHRSQDLYCH